jgi:hypothetical protein
VYCLTGDLKVGLASGYAIQISANNVVLDLNGHRLSNSGDSATSAIGIFASGIQDVTVRNGTVKGFYMGVDLNGALSVVVEGIQADQNRRIGIFVAGQAVIVRDNVILATGGTTALGPDSDAFGILVDGSGNAVLRNDVAGVTKQGSGTAYGISAASGPHLVVGNRISVADYAIAVDAPGGAKYRDNLSVGMALAPYVGGGIDAGNNN